MWLDVSAETDMFVELKDFCFIFISDKSISQKKRSANVSQGIAFLFVRISGKTYAKAKRASMAQMVVKVLSRQVCEVQNYE